MQSTLAQRGALPGASTVPDAASQDGNQKPALSSASAMQSRGGVLLRWQPNYEFDNLGFNIYRVQNGQRSQANSSIIPGSVFLVGAGKPVPSGYSYQWFDKEGTADSVYYIEIENLNGSRYLFESAIYVSSEKQAENQPGIEAIGGSVNGPASSFQGLKEYPAEPAAPQSVQGQIDTQWVVAGQSALKIQINHDGWYRVTQQQMSAAGFNPIVDVKNLSVFADGTEIAIKTSKATGPLTTGDYLEFYGRGLDTPDSDSRTYYLIAGTQPGKRSAAEVQTDGAQSAAIDHSTVAPGLDLTYRGWFAPLVNLTTDQQESTTREAGREAGVVSTKSSKVVSLASANPNPAPISESSAPAVREEAVPKAEPTTPAAAEPTTPQPAVVPSSSVRKRKTARSRRSNLRRSARTSKPHYSHAFYETTASTLSFDYTIQLKERYKDSPSGFIPVYFTQALNGEAENWFGKVITSLAAVETIPLHSVNLSAVGPARLEVALQGVAGSNPTHQMNVSVNNTIVGTMQFFGNDHGVQTFNIPITQLVEGNNTVKIDRGSGNDISIVDYVTFTYPHSYQVFNNALTFTLRSSQTLRVDGFSTPNVQLLDISDPTAVRVTQPASAASGSGYAITVPVAPKSKARRPQLSAPELQPIRTMYALPQGQFETPAGFSLNQPSTLNLASNQADLLIISHKDFIPSLSANVAPINTSFIAKRTSDGLLVKVVNIEDVYDEFSYGAHDHHSIKDLLLRASNVWAKAPRYVLLVGDASNDPRNYEALAGGGGDLVPTNLVDTLFGEACSDDVLADFDNNGIAEIPVGRLPAGNVAEANLMVSKIVNFSKATVPQTALLVADDNTDPPYYFDFEGASDQLATLMQPTLTVQKIYRRIQGTCTARTNTINTMNQGVALVNYSGHGNVNVWAGSCNGQTPFFQNPDARGLTNGNNHLPLVIVANCLNGQFNLPPLESLAEAFLKNPNGGGVAVYASSGETIPDGQQQMNVKLYQTLFGAQSMALGDVTKLAKTATTDMDVRRTWILLGDPSMKIW